MIDHTTFTHMVAEMDKLAANGGLSSLLRPVGQYIGRSAGNIGAGIGAGALLGGVGNAVHKGYRGYRDAKEEGSSGVGGALSGAVHGLGKGALTGAAVGGAAGLASGGRGSEKVQELLQVGKNNPLSVAGRFGQRQLHSVTGLVPGGALRGSPEHLEALHQMNIGGLHNLRAAASEGGHAAGVYQRALDAANAGQTSIPGMLGNVKDKGVVEGAKDVLRHGLGRQWKDSGAGGKAMMVGMPLAFAGMEAAADNPEDERGMGEKVVGSLGSSMGFALNPMLPMTAMNAVTTAATKAGKGAGKGIDKLVGRVRRPGEGGLGQLANPANEANAGSAPVERVYSNAALGRPPEDMLS